MVILVDIWSLASHVNIFALGQVNDLINCLSCVFFFFFKHSVSDHMHFAEPSFGG